MGINLLGAIGNAKPVSEFINTAGQYQTTQSNLETQRMQQQKLKAETAQTEKDNREYHEDAALALFPEHQRGNIKKAWTMAGYLGEGRVIRGKDARSTPDLFKKFPELAVSVNQTEKDYLLRESERLGKKGDPESQAKALEHAAEAANLQRLIDKETGGADKGFTLGEGQRRFDPSGREIAAVAKPPEPTKTRTIKEGDIERTEEWVNGAWVPIATAPRYKPTTNVITNVNTGLDRGARAKAQEEVQEGTDLYTGLQRVIELSRPEYFTYAGQIQARAEKIGEKAGMVKDPAMLGGYSAWKVGVEQEFNKYRKWVTGVAAGPQELELIRQTFPNRDMSETEFQAAARQTAVTTWKLVERRRRALAAGIMDERKQKEFYRLLPLDSMPNPPADFLGRFSGGVPSDLPSGTVDNGDGTFTLPGGKRVRPKQ